MKAQGNGRRQPTLDGSSIFQLDMPKFYLAQVDHQEAIQTSSEARHGQPPRTTSKAPWLSSTDKVSAYTATDERESFRTLALTFTTVLNQTQDDETSRLRRSGTRSLFSTCLAIIPHLIQDERRDASTSLPTQTSEESLDSSEGYGYSELEEDFGSPGPPGSGPGSGSGWRHLGEVLRHHIILLLSNAIKAGLIGLLGARELIYICLREDAVDGAQKFLESCLSHVAAGAAQDNTARSREVFGSRPVLEGMVREFCERTGREGFAYRWLEELLGDRRYVSFLMVFSFSMMQFPRRVIPTSPAWMKAYRGDFCSGSYGNTELRLMCAFRTPASWLSSRFTLSTLNKAIGSLTYGDSDDTQQNNHIDQAATLLRTVIRSSYALDTTASSKAVHSLRLQNSSAKRCKEAVSRFNHTEAPTDVSMKPLHVLVDDQPGRFSGLVKVSFSVLSMLSAMNILDLVSEGPPRRRCECPFVLHLLPVFCVE